MLQPEGARALGPEALITSENIEEYLPAPAAAAEAQRFFSEAGFEVGGVVGNSFSITAPPRLFEKMFGVKIRLEENASVKALSADGVESYELPVAALPEELRRDVAAVTFTPPPDFGPTSY